MADLEWWGYFAIAVLPVLGFYLGVRFQVSSKPERVETPAPPVESLSTSELRVLDAIESLRAEIGELAERQDFAERLIAQQRASQPSLPSKRPITPV